MIGNVAQVVALISYGNTFLKTGEDKPLALNSDGSTLAVAGDQGEAIVYDVGSAHEIARIPELAGAPRMPDGSQAGALAFGPDGRLYVGSEGNRLRVFDGKTFALIKSIPVPEYATAGTMKFFAGGNTVVARGLYLDQADNFNQVGVIARIDLQNASTVWKLDGDDYGFGECASFAFSELTNRLWCGTYFGLIRERSLLTGLKTGKTLFNEKGWIGTLDLMDTPTGQVLEGGGINSGAIGRWKVDGGGAIARRVAGDRTIVGELADGKTLLVASRETEQSDPTLSLWDSTTDSEVPGLPPMLVADVFGNAMDAIFSLKEIGTYDVTTGRKQSIAVALDRNRSFIMSRDGAELVTADADAHVVLYEVSTGRIIQQFTVPSPIPSTDFIAQVSLSDDHSRIYIGGHGLWVYDASTGEQLGHNGDTQIGNIALGPPGVVVASRSDGTLARFDPDTVEEVASLPGSGFPPLISDDGSLMIGIDRNANVSFVDVKAGILLGDPIATTRSGDGPDVAIRGDGLQAATNGPDGKGVVLWDLDPEHWVTAACAIAGRNLTEQEWSTYIGDLGDYRATCPEYPPAA